MKRYHNILIYGPDIPRREKYTFAIVCIVLFVATLLLSPT